MLGIKIQKPLRAGTRPAPTSSRHFVGGRPLWSPDTRRGDNPVVTGNVGDENTSLYGQAQEGRAQGLPLRQRVICRGDPCGRPIHGAEVTLVVTRNVGDKNTSPCGQAQDGRAQGQPLRHRVIL